MVVGKSCCVSYRIVFLPPCPLSRSQMVEWDQGRMKKYEAQHIKEGIVAAAGRRRDLLPEATMPQDQIEFPASEFCAAADL